MRFFVPFSALVVALFSSTAFAQTAPVLESPGVGAASIGPEGARVGTEEDGLVLGLSAIRRGESRVTLVARPAERDGVDARAVRAAGVEEWWRALPSGLEHGVDLAVRPPGVGPLLVEVRGTGLVPALESDDRVVFRRRDGERVFSYGGLVVVDADGRRVPARMRVAGDDVVLEIDDRAARYPIVVDPLLASIEGTLLGGAGRTGWSAAISGDGSTAIVGEIFGGPSAAWIFERTGTTWALQRQISAPVGATAFGVSVALSGDGNVALIGASNETVGGVQSGVVHVWERAGTTWTEAATLLASDRLASDDFGSAVDLSLDGSRAVVGAYHDDRPVGSNAGSAYVFLRTSTGWVEETALRPSITAPNEGFGYDVALSDDGLRVLVGAYFGILPGGAQGGTAWVFVRSGTTWTEETRLLSTSLASGAFFGISVALDGDGSRALVGAVGDDGMQRGTATVFARAGTAWTTEATLRATGAAVGDEFGHAVAISPDGLRAVVAARSDDTPGGMNAGSARVFQRTGTGWSELLSIAGTAAAGELGYDVGLSSDGSRVALGAWGASRAFVYHLTGEPNGVACSVGSDCISDHCVDGVCCDTACGGGVVDCQACSGALTGGASGTCGSLLTSVAPTVTCRASAGDCDVAEVCDPTSTACPSDAVRASDSVCRASAGACDVAEVCDGSSIVCPGDVLSSPGTLCGVGVGDCAMPAVCDGTTPACPGPGVRPAGTECRAASSECDVADSCDGISEVCPALFAPATQLCGAAPSGPCDVADTCSGTSADCQARLASGVECRAASAACDAAEVCSGASVDCPADVNACVADAGLPDAGGVDGGGGVGDGGGADVGSVDAGVVPPAAGGCACRTQGGSGTTAALGMVALAIGLRRRRARRVG